MPLTMRSGLWTRPLQRGDGATFRFRRPTHPNWRDAAYAMPLLLPVVESKHPAEMSRIGSPRYTVVVIRNDLGRQLREENLRTLSPERKIELNYIELSSILALTPDRGWSEFVRRWRRRRNR